MAASLTDVAKSAGVSIATASRILNGVDYPVADKTRRKVLEAAQVLSYRPNLIARSLRKDQTYTIGIIVENILSPFVPAIIRGIEERLNQNSYFSIIFDSNWDPVAEVEAIKHLGMRQIDGIIIVESFLYSSDDVYALVNRPHVFVHRLFDSLSPNSIAADDREGARRAVNHLIQLGHRRIAFINGAKDWDAATNRLAGYQEALATAQLAFDPTLVHQGDWQVQAGYTAAQHLLALAERPTAVFAANDLMALGVVYAAQEAGLTVPANLAIVGYDDRDLAGFVRPGLTTIRMPCEQMGHVAAESLLRLIHGELTAIEPTLVCGELIVRQSCGAQKGAWTFEPERANPTQRRPQKQV